MRTAGVREARQDLTSLLDDVRKGREVIITERGRAVARLVPVKPRKPPRLGLGTSQGTPDRAAALAGHHRRSGRSRVSVAQPPPPPTWAEPIYLDASALVKLFVPEPESEGLNHALVGAEDVIVSDLALTEMASALGRRRREGSLTLAESRRLYREAEKLAASCRRAELTPPIHRRAERLLLSSLEVPLRTFDALHVATALDAEAATLVAYDPRLRDAAASQGLFVAPEGLRRL